MEPNKRSKVTTRSVMLSVLLAMGLTACGNDWRADEVRVGILISPKGAVAPEGLDEITIESTQDEVIQILGSRHEFDPNRFEWPEDREPHQDVFLYKEGDVTKYIDVWYKDRTVEQIFYGYDEVRGIE